MPTAPHVRITGLEAVLIQRVLDEPGFWCSDALIDSERLAQVPGGLGIIAGKLTAAEAGSPTR